MPIDPENPLLPLVTAWLQKIRAAKKHKGVKFQEVADEVMKFFNGGAALNEHMYGRDGKKHFVVSDDDEVDIPAPVFRMTVNKVAEVKQLFAPTLYHKNPARTVTTRQFEPLPPELFGDVNMDPMAFQAWQQSQMEDQQEQLVRKLVSELVSGYLNYTPGELDLKTNTTDVIDEGLMKGCGVWWTEIYETPGFKNKLVGSFHDTVDNLLGDPDTQKMEDWTWCARVCEHPEWQIEDTYGLPRGTMKKALHGRESENARAEQDTTDDVNHERANGKTNDVKTYYKIYSKMGLGGRLTGIDADLKGMFEEFGDYCYLVVAEGIPYPLNLPPDLLKAVPEPTGDEAADAIAQEEYQGTLVEAVEWPLPLWADGTWPFTPLAFHRTPNCAWPTSHVSFGLGELKFLNWCMGFLAGKVRNGCRTWAACIKGLEESIKNAFLSGGEMVLMEIPNEHGTKLSDVISFLQAPAFPVDIYNVLDRVAEQFDKRIGLSEILYGMSGATQDRSATETQIKQQNSTTRIADMADKVATAMKELARKEAIAARWVLTEEDVRPILGTQRAALWAQLVQSADMSLLVRELEYSIESDNVERINRQSRINAMNQALSTLSPVLQQYGMQTGDVAPWNRLISDWAKSMDLDASGYLLQPPPMPMQPAEGQPQEAAA